MPLKKSYGIELDSDQEKFMKTRFKCQSDDELRNVLQRICDSLISKQLNVDWLSDD